MDPYLTIALVVLVIVLLFFGATAISNNKSDSGEKIVNRYPPVQSAGGACGR